MFEGSAPGTQLVNPGESIIFTVISSPCRQGYVRHRNDTGDFLLSGYLPLQNRGCCCNRNRSAGYLVTFGANIAIPEGETVGEISLAFSVNGTTVPVTTMRATPAAVEQFSNVNASRLIDIWNGCCETLSVRNTSTIPVTVGDANILISRPDLYLSR